MLLVAERGIEGITGDLKSVMGTGPNDPRYVQYQRSMEYRRAFICADCLKHIDDDVSAGVAVVVRDGRARLFQLAGDSRWGRARAYDHRKWLTYQRRQASAMGIAFES
jgi:hypothetical protein